MSHSDKPSVDGLMRLRFFRDLTISERFKILGVFGVVPEGVTIDEMNHSIERRLFDVAVERLAALAGPLEQPQEPKSDRANLAQASGVCDLQTALPEGCTPADARVLREACFKFASEEQRLRKALRYYADKSHFMLADDSAWDTVSGEPRNFWCDEAGTATIEDGSIAAMALRGVEIDWSEGEPPLCQGEPEHLMTIRCGRGCSCCTQCGDWYELHNRPKPKE